MHLLVSAVDQAAKGGVTMPVPMDNPILQLRREHDEALAVLDRLEGALHDLAAPEALVAVQRAVEFLDEEVRAHNQREEESLFPALEVALPPPGPAAALRSEHREFSKLLSKLKFAISQIPFSPGTGEIGLAAVDLLRRHIRKENGIVFPMAQQLLSAEEMSQMKRKMEELIEDQEAAAATPWAV
jgi:hemerythrin-like domain-containing protein